MKYPQREVRKPKGFQPGSVKGKIQARIANALKTLASENVAYITLEGQRYKFLAADEASLEGWGHLGMFVVRSKYGYTLRDIFSDDNYYWYETLLGRRRYLNYRKDILCLAELTGKDEG